MWVSLKRTACRSNPALRLASGWSSRAATACATALKWRFPIARPAPRPARARHRQKARASGAAKRAHEPLAAVHPAAGGDLALDGRDPARRRDRLSPLAALGLARGGLPDDPGRHLLSRREPGRDDFLDHRAARAPVGPDAGSQADVLHQLRGASVITLQFSLELTLDVAE